MNYEGYPLAHLEGPLCLFFINWITTDAMFIDCQESYGVPSNVFLPIFAYDDVQFLKGRCFCVCFLTTIYPLLQVIEALGPTKQTTHVQEPANIPWLWC